MLRAMSELVNTIKHVDIRLGQYVLILPVLFVVCSP